MKNTFTTLAGSPGDYGSANGTGNAARFCYPTGVAVDSAGNVYVADNNANTIRKITKTELVSPKGVVVGTIWVVSTVAGKAGVTGSLDGIGSAAQFNGPEGVAVDSLGNVLYVADCGNHTIRKITLSGTQWKVSTLAGSPGVSGSDDGTGSAARFNSPCGLAQQNGVLYVADNGNHTIRKLFPKPTGYVVMTLAGKAGSSGSACGSVSAARFNNPSWLAVDGNGYVYVTDTGNQAIRLIMPVKNKWMVGTLAGKTGFSGSADGSSAAQFNGPEGVAVDDAGKVLYVADAWNNTIRMITRVRGLYWKVSTLAGKPGNSGSADGSGSAAQFYFPVGVAVGSNGNVYVADAVNATIRMGS